MTKTFFQFAQFALLTQSFSVFGTYALGFIGSHKVKVIVTGQLVRTTFIMKTMFKYTQSVLNINSYQSIFSKCNSRECQNGQNIFFAYFISN